MRLLLIICALAGFTSRHYSHDFVERYGEDHGYNSYVYLVIPREEGYIIVENVLFKEFEYYLHLEEYLSYSSFLYEVLNDKSFPLSHDWHVYKSSKDVDMLKRKQEWLMRRFLRFDGKGAMVFKRHISKDKEQVIIKLMFDWGYYVGWRDYRAEWFFFSELAPMLPPIPKEM